MGKRKRPPTCNICEVQSSTDICPNCGASRQAIDQIIGADMHHLRDFDKLNFRDIKRLINQTEQKSNELWVLTSPSYRRKTLTEFQEAMLGHVKYKSAVMVPTVVTGAMLVGSVSCYAHIEWSLSPLYAGAIAVALLITLGWSVAIRLEDYADTFHPMPPAPSSICTALMNRTVLPWYLEKNWQTPLALAIGFAIPIIYCAVTHSQ